MLTLTQHCSGRSECHFCSSSVVSCAARLQLLAVSEAPSERHTSKALILDFLYAK